MLTNLSIKNYALIENISVEFKDKLSIITGETGAGKSVLLGALGLVLGKRADSTSLKDSSKKCIIEGQFAIGNYKLEAFFDEEDIDYEEETIIRREILPSGKSRAFINDTPTTLSVLNQLGEQLIDIHSQHQTLQLSDAQFQLGIIDAIAGNEAKLVSYRRGLGIFKNQQKALRELLASQESAKAQYDYNLHLYEEIKNADFKENEQEQLEQTLDKLNNSEEIRINLSEAFGIASAEEVGLQSQMHLFSGNLGKISTFSKEYKELFTRANSLKIELDDLTQELERLNEDVDYDPVKIEQLNDRLQLLYDLQKKHSASTISELKVIEASLEEKVAVVESANEHLAKIESELRDTTQKLTVLSEKISLARAKAIPIFVTKLEGILSNLGMQNTRFKFNLNQTDNFGTNGNDELELLVSANKGGNYGALKKVASGGELSRIMLATKAILCEYLDLPTIIFDEIDTGVSGDISQKMADIMAQMSGKMQVITITHLPQIAAKGNQHYKVYKEESQDDVVTKLVELSENERIIEIAEMLSGKNASSTAIEHAKDLLN